MRPRWMGLACVTTMFTASPTLAGSDWLEALKLPSEQLRQLCGQSDGLTTLARSQMVAAGDAEWRRLARVDLAVERFGMGASPLDSAKCYVYVRAGDASETQRRAFEVRDFASNPDRVLVMVVGWDVQLSE